MRRVSFQAFTVGSAPSYNETGNNKILVETGGLKQRCGGGPSRLNLGSFNVGKL